MKLLGLTTSEKFLDLRTKGCYRQDAQSTQFLQDKWFYQQPVGLPDSYKIPHEAALSPKHNPTEIQSENAFSMFKKRWQPQLFRPWNVQFLT